MPGPRAACHSLIALAMLSLPGGPAAAASSGSFSFAVVGDMPYGAVEERRARNVIDAVNAAPAVRLVLHVGDVKGGGERCDDAILRQRHRLLGGFGAPLVVTPGDNDWTDCHRRSNGQYLPTERLAMFRRLFYPDPSRSAGGRGISLQSQSATPGFEPYVENALWRMGGVTFGTVHVVGSRNGLEPWNELDPEDTRATPRADRLAEVAQRDYAAVAWVDVIFDAAAAEDSAAVVIAIHANPHLEDPPGSDARSTYERFLARVQARAVAFGRPVLFLHGDTHRFRHDQPLRGGDGRPLSRFTRVESFGSPFLHWVEVIVDPGDPAVFRIVPRAGEANDPFR